MRRTFIHPDQETAGQESLSGSAAWRSAGPGRHGLPHRFAAPDASRYASVVPTPVDWEGVRRHSRRS